MKKATSRKIESTKASLRELPEVDLHAFTVRRNRFAARVAAEGIQLVGGVPTTEIPCIAPCPLSGSVFKFAIPGRAAHGLPSSAPSRRGVELEPA